MLHVLFTFNPFCYLRGGKKGRREKGRKDEGREKEMNKVNEYDRAHSIISE